MSAGVAGAHKTIADKYLKNMREKKKNTANGYVAAGNLRGGWTSLYWNVTREIIAYNILRYSVEESERKMRKNKEKREFGNEFPSSSSREEEETKTPCRGKRQCCQVGTCVGKFETNDW